MTTITAHIPAKTMKSKMTGKVFSWPAKVLTFAQDGAGRWAAIVDGESHPVTQADVIADCRGAKNWAAIRSAHFAMADHDRIEGRL